MSKLKSGLQATAQVFRDHADMVAYRRHACRFYDSVAGTGLLAGMFTLLAGSALAQDVEIEQPVLLSLIQVAGFSVLIGAVSTVLLFTVWLVRQRGNLEKESRAMKSSLAEAQQRLSQFQALTADTNRKIVIWTGQERPSLLGQLPLECGAPQSDNFLAFGRWLQPASALQLEKAISQLRDHAESFDITVETAHHEVVEVQGRVSGACAFAQFVALSNIRKELAQTKLERDRLRISVEAFEAMLNAVNIPAWHRDQRGELCWVNKAYCDAVGVESPPEALKDKRELLATAALERIRTETAQSPVFYERLSTVVGGNRIFFDVTDTKIDTGHCGLAVDVSQMEELRAELKRTLASHAETLDHLATPVAIFDKHQCLQFYNQAFAALWKLDIAFLESKPDNSEILERLRGAKMLPEQLNWRSWKEAALSVYRSIETQSDLWHLPNGQILRVFATAHPQGGATWVFENLTEQVNLETRYNMLLKVQGETIDHLSEGVAVFGPDGRISLSNPAFRVLWGLTETQVMPGTHIRHIGEACTHSYDKTDGWKAFAERITSFDDERRSIQGTLELMTGLILDYAVIPLPDAQTMVTFVNMTDSVRAERALTEKNEALHKADELKNDFVQHVSYELRSPLTNIIGFTDLLRTPALGTLNERQSDYVNHISTSSSVLLTLVNDIVDLATFDAGIMRLHYSEIALNDLVRDASLQIADRLQEGQIKLEINARDDLGTITADPQRLKQILVKLLGNAANFSPEGSSIQLDCHRDNEDFIFSITDKGPGMSQDLLNNVFDRFSTGSKTGKRGGAGLGLSIVDSFVTLHHGKVTIDSAPGRGTVVTCRIPSLHHPLVAAAE